MTSCGAVLSDRLLSLLSCFVLVMCSVTGAVCDDLQCCSNVFSDWSLAVTSGLEVPQVSSFVQMVLGSHAQLKSHFLVYLLPNMRSIFCAR